MEAPEKIYIFENPILDFTKLSVKQNDNDIEYTRTDAFIEKACKFLDKELPITDLSPSNMLDITFKVFDKESKRVFIEDFKNYMKGE
jgi:hypothetical protein